MPKKGQPHPLKGVPRSEWPKKVDMAAPPAPEPVPSREAMKEQLRDDLPKFVEAVALNNEMLDSRPRETSDVQQEWTPEAPPPNLFSGEMLKLQVYGKNGDTKEPIPGFELYWFNDEHNSGVRINQALRSGWQFVDMHEIALNEGLTPTNADLGSHVRQIVGTMGAEPLYAYLMKKPKWLYDLHNDQREQATNVRVEQALRAGRVGNADPAIGPSRTVKIDIGSKLYRQGA